MVQHILEQILILFIIMIVGYIARRRNFLDAKLQRGLSSIVVNIGIPAAILSMVSMKPEPLQRKMYFIGIVLSFVYHVLLFYLSKYISAKIIPDPAKAKIAPLLLTFSNCMFVGFPILQGLYGKGILLYAGAIVVSFNIVMYSFALPSLRGEEKGNLRSKILTPFNFATLILLIFLFAGWTFPDPIQKSLDYLAAINTPLSLIVIGSSLASSDLGRVFKDLKLYLMSIFRCLVIPGIVLLFLAILPHDLDPDLIRAMVIIAAMPSAANNAMLAEQTDTAPGWAAMAVTQSTFVFIPCLIIIVPIMEKIL